MNSYMASEYRHLSVSRLSHMTQQSAQLKHGIRLHMSRRLHTRCPGLLEAVRVWESFLFGHASFDGP